MDKLRRESLLGVPLEQFREPLICSGVEGAVNPSLEASCRHTRRQVLHTGTDKWLPELF
ncbi:hypothetical protein [Halorhodospira halochloris]|uniref:hypothetical protein n=1 Tax=Halorhodospira halochloris TaxID=1052 RepID=UPI00076F69C8|nr:hypothetical protein [Halorhodospira halochloris]